MKHNFDLIMTRAQVFDEAKVMQERYLRDATGHLSGYFQGWEFIKEVQWVCLDITIYKTVVILG